MRLTAVGMFAILIKKQCFPHCKEFSSLPNLECQNSPLFPKTFVIVQPGRLQKSEMIVANGGLQMLFGNDKSVRADTHHFECSIFHQDAKCIFVQIECVCQ